MATDTFGLSMRKLGGSRSLQFTGFCAVPFTALHHRTTRKLTTSMVYERITSLRTSNGLRYLVIESMDGYFILTVHIATNAATKSRKRPSNDLRSIPRKRCAVKRIREAFSQTNKCSKSRSD